MCIDNKGRKIYLYMEDLLAVYKVIGLDWGATYATAQKIKRPPSKLYPLRDKGFLITADYRIAKLNARGAEKLAVYWRVTPKGIVNIIKNFDIEIPLEHRKFAALALMGAFKTKFW